MSEKPSAVSAQPSALSRRTASGSSQPPPPADHSALSAHRSALGPQASLGVATDFELPHGFGSRRTWEFTVALLGAAVEPERLLELVRGTAIVGYRDGEVVVSAPERAQAERLAGEYGELVARKLSEAMRRPVRLAVLIPEAAGEQAGGPRAMEPRPEPPAARATRLDAIDAEPEAPSFVVAECGLPNRQVWAAVLDEVAASGGVSAANVDAWLRSTQLIGRGADGRLVVGAVHALAQRRIVARFAGPLRAAAAAILGREVALDVVVQRDWLLDNASSAAGPDQSIGAA